MIPPAVRKVREVPVEVIKEVKHEIYVPVDKIVEKTVDNKAHMQTTQVLQRQVEKQDVVVPDEVLRVEDSISVFPKANETDEIDLT